jgi:hypothetical protein
MEKYFENGMKKISFLKEITDGGTLIFKMGPEPNKKWEPELKMLLLR